MNVQCSPLMRTWVTLNGVWTRRPFVSVSSMLTIRQFPWNDFNEISGSGPRRAVLGNGAGANASGPINRSKASPRRIFIALLRGDGGASSVPLHGDDPVALRRRVE